MVRFGGVCTASAPDRTVAGRGQSPALERRPAAVGRSGRALQVFSTLPAQQRPTVRLRTTGDTDYQALSEVMVAVDNAGLMSGLGIDADD